MKKQLLICLLLIFASCGEKKDGTNKSKQTKDQSPIEGSLSVDEKKFIDKLLNLKSLSQKDLLKEILLIEDIRPDSLKKIDKYLIIDCTISQGMCQIAKGEKL